MPTETIIPDTHSECKPARLLSAMAESRLRAARDAARYCGYDNADDLDPLDDQTDWSAERGYHKSGEAVTVVAVHAPVTITAADGRVEQMTATHYEAQTDCDACDGTGYRQGGCLPLPRCRVCGGQGQIAPSPLAKEMITTLRMLQPGTREKASSLNP